MSRVNRRGNTKLKKYTGIGRVLDKVLKDEVSEDKAEAYKIMMVWKKIKASMSGCALNMKLGERNNGIKRVKKEDRKKKWCGKG